MLNHIAAAKAIHSLGAVVRQIAPGGATRLIPAALYTHQRLRGPATIDKPDMADRHKG
ncbi:hypothetical protein SAMN02983003_3301 [Devosia enhydra]|uniref:Uncharacterized protein n=1 Tax=Devosia enhydra TaxID=665118 RepID=A0A1K2I1I7_9HYPH|nr:hypothetical protein SAMN02983003_3301 [Devosia enhydra]